MPTQVADPKQISNITNPAERDKNAAVSKNSAVPLEVMWERQFEQEKSLSQEKSDTVAEAQRIFSSTGSMPNEYKPHEVSPETTEIQVEDKQVKSSEFNSDMWMDMFKKPLENATNIAGTLINEAPTAIEAVGDLIQQIIPGSEAQPEEKKVNPDEFKETQWKNFVTQKKGETNAAISQIAMQRKMEEVLYIIGTPTSQDAAAELGMNPDLNQEHITDKYHAVLLATKQSENIQKALKEKEHQEAAEVQTPEIVADLEGGVEGGTGRGTHIMSVAGGGE